MRFPSGKATVSQQPFLVQTSWISAVTFPENSPVCSSCPTISSTVTASDELMVSPYDPGMLFSMDAASCSLGDWQESPIKRQKVRRWYIFMVTRFEALKIVNCCGNA